MYQLPKAIEIEGRAFNIRNEGDYRVILDTLAAFQDMEISERERVISSLIVFYEDVNSVEDALSLKDPEEMLKQMMNFISCGEEEIGYQTHHKLIDWQQDEKLITSAVNNVARTEIRALPYLHWWTFIGYYMAIGECPLSMIVGIRAKIAKGKKLEKYEQEFKRENQQYFKWKSEQKEADLMFAEIWDDKEGL